MTHLLEVLQLVGFLEILENLPMLEFSKVHSGAVLYTSVASLPKCSGYILSCLTLTDKTADIIHWIVGAVFIAGTKLPISTCWEFHSGHD